MTFSATRQTALEHLGDFLADAPRYAARRNYVLSGHPQVSRLSAAIRHRLITEAEVVEATLRRYPFRAVEKFLQEVLWRSYWKGWLEMRPQIWQSYAAAVSQKPDSEDVCAVAEGLSRSGIMNHFARELLETGYMHNHARMWWASHWIHHSGLPWELGADHFFRHLLDADPASNTLSWRWVAGLQTRGKTYLATAQNITKHCAPEILEAAGAVGFEDGVVARMVREDERPDETVSPLEDLPCEYNPRADERTVVVLHDEDLCLENSPLAKVRPAVVLQFVPKSDSPLPAPRAEWLAAARSDAARRAKEHFGCDVLVCRNREDLRRECAAQKATTLLMMEPFVGPLRDELGGVPEELAGHGIDVVRLRRKWDSALLPHAARGFFPFWNKVGRLLAKSGTQTLS
ncbi:MAG: FAD-binding domain-containing protein [Chthoniobacterales bacterium]